MSLTAWIVSDGTRGMEVQSRALAEALGAAATVKRIRPAPWLRAFPALGGCPVVPATLGGDPLQPPWPDLVIGCGRRNAGAVLSVKTRSGGQSFAVQIQDPRIAPARFDALIVPEHDPARGENVILTTGSLNAIGAMDLRAEAARFVEMTRALPGPRVLVAVGGPTRRQAVEDGLADRFVDDLGRLLEAGCGLMITASRRTPPRLARALEQLAESEAAALLWDGTGDNPYFGFMGAADAIVVTSDSVNMTSEACSSGRSVYVADLLVPSGRIAAFHKTLRDRGLARRFHGSVEPYAYQPLNDAALAADMVAKRISAHISALSANKEAER